MLNPKTASDRAVAGQIASQGRVQPDGTANVVAAALDLHAVGRLVGLDIAGPRVAFTSG
jgi:hypothetical protein